MFFNHNDLIKSLVCSSFPQIIFFHAQQGLMFVFLSQRHEIELKRSSHDLVSYIIKNQFYDFGNTHPACICN